MAAKSGQIRELRVIAISSDTTVADFTHHGTLLDVTATSAIVTITLPAAATMPNGFTVTIRRNAASTKNVSVAGGATATLTESDTLVVYTTDSAAWIQTGSTIGIFNNVHINHGFQNRTDSSVTFTATSPTRTVSIAPASTTFVYWRDGTKVTKSTAQTATITDTVGMWYVYFNTSDVLTTSQVFPGIIASEVLVAFLYWNGTAARRQDERHGYRRNLPFHLWAHDTIGTRYESGLVGTFTDTTVAFTEGYIHDEDIDFYIGAQTNCVVWSKVAATGKMTFADATTPYLAAVGALQYDDNGTPTAVGVAKFVVNDVYASLDLDRPIYVRVGTAEYSTLATARAAPQATWANVVSAELKLLYRVIYKNTGGSPDYVEATDYRTSGSVPAGGTPSISAHGSTHLSTDPIPLVSGSIIVGSASDVSAAVAMSGDATIIASGALTVANSAISNAKMANMNAHTFKGNNTAGAAAPSDLTIAQMQSELAGTSPVGAALTSGNIWVGSAGNVAASVAMSSDVTMVASGAVTIAAKAVTLAKMNDMATASFLARTSAGAGAPEVISAANSLIALTGYPAKYSTNANQSIPTTSVTIVDFEDSIYDTGSQVTTGAAWKFTATLTGKYIVCISFLFDSGAFASTNKLWFGVYKNNVFAGYIFYKVFEASITAEQGGSGALVIDLTATEYCDIRAFQTSGGGRTLYADGAYNNVSVTKIS